MVSGRGFTGGNRMLTAAHLTAIGVINEKEFLILIHCTFKLWYSLWSLSEMKVPLGITEHRAGLVSRSLQEHQWTLWVRTITPAIRHRMGIYNSHFNRIEVQEHTQTD